MASQISASIGESIAAVPGISEAHLPQCFVLGVMEAPAQVLVIVAAPDSSFGEIWSAVGTALTRSLPSDQSLDVLALSSDSELLTDVRAAGCEILHARGPHPPGRRVWWRFWDRG
jgi:hypothetical protein